MRALSCALLCVSGVAQATSADVTSASPDAPAVELAWRGSLRAKAGLRIAFVAPQASESGLLVELPFFIELHNWPGKTSVVPYELWRARVALFGGYRWGWPGWRVDALAGLEHESDHATAPNIAERFPDSGFVALNDLALVARVRRRVRHPTAVQLISRVHLLTCTASTAECGAGHGLLGDQTLEVSLEASQELTLDEAARWALFASLGGEAWVATPRNAPSRRAALRVGRCGGGRATA